MMHQLKKLGLLAGMTATLALSGGRALAQQQQTETVELFPVCNNVTLTWPSGTPMTEVVAAITPTSNLRAIWRFNNTRQRFEGFSPQFPEQSDLRTANRLDAVFICMIGPGMLTRPLI
ncbi:MAG: hypothetical protein C4290_12845 [Chloroflexota bacterium]